MLVTPMVSDGTNDDTQRKRPALFDAHLHIIDPRFPLTANHGYLPPAFTVQDYRSRTRHLNVVGGAVISGSFQGFDQTYLLDALTRLGPGFVGVTQLPASATTGQIESLTSAGVRAVRFNLFRGGGETLNHLADLAQRVHETAGWHTELYLDARDLPELEPILTALPQISIDHLGLSRHGFPALLRLAEHGAYVKATGFSRGDLDVPTALRDLAHANPSTLIAGTDLPSTRAPRPFRDADLDLIINVLGEHLTAGVLRDNACTLYRVAP
ncbi:amidohydrolase family protein [Dermatophilaceae bacterium Sec6.4]